MKSVLLIPLQGPMQSWGTRSRFQERDTEREPSKSGIIGLLCAALGRDRSTPIEDLSSLKMGVRVDREGFLKRDFQTAQNVVTASGTQWEDQISTRQYLADAIFMVALEGDRDVLQRLHNALAKPVWPLFLGRKSYVPSHPVYLLDGLYEAADTREALKKYPLLCAPRKEQDEIRLILESSSVTHESRIDTPVSFALGGREFRLRYVVTEFIPVDSFHLKEDDNVPISTRA
jgi:CRISPR system Cascade subunit CasD